MTEFIIEWDAGYGTNYKIVECDTEAEAGEVAYQEWREEAEMNADYGVVGEATDELKEDYGL
jgi:hypothetical protein